VLVAQGVANRSTWKLATYTSGKRTCSVVIRNGNAVEYACGFNVPGQRPVMSNWTTEGAASADSVFVHGQVVEQAARVRIEFAHHIPIELPALQAPTDVGVRFFVASLRLPGAFPTAVVALDEHGTELGRQNLTFPPKSNQADGQVGVAGQHVLKSFDGSRRQNRARTRHVKSPQRQTTRTGPARRRGRRGRGRRR
jgi:hypothetical protein